MKQLLISFFLFTFLNASAQDATDSIPTTLVKHEKVKAGYGVPVAQTPPQFGGGPEALKKFLLDNIKYPESARSRKVSGTVYVGFIVDKNGKITEEKILSSVDPDLDAEALRVIRLMPDWNPATAGGVPIDLQYIIPFDFYFPDPVK